MAFILGKKFQNNFQSFQISKEMENSEDNIGITQ